MTLNPTVVKSSGKIIRTEKAISRSTSPSEESNPKTAAAMPGSVVCIARISTSSYALMSIEAVKETNNMNWALAARNWSSV